MKWVVGDLNVKLANNYGLCGIILYNYGSSCIKIVIKTKSQRLNRFILLCNSIGILSYHKHKNNTEEN